jgi:hypothetical protein
MIHDIILTYTLAFHSGVLVIAFVAFYHYGDRQGLLVNQESEPILNRLRARIVIELAGALEPIFEMMGDTISPLLGSDGQRYSERATNPFGSERFHGCIQQFIDGNSPALVDYKMLTEVREKWLTACRLRSWSILFFIGVELLFAGGIALVEKVFLCSLPDGVLIGSIFFMIAGIVYIFVLFMLNMRYRDRIASIRIRHHEI